MAGNEYLWQDYLEQFTYFTEDMLRAGCYPRKMMHTRATADSVVLIHGLSDSPAVMMDLARHYHENMGCNVYLPLLQGHGLKEPDGMRGVCLKAWKENVHFAITAAAADAKRLSIGGLSTGGALALYFACLDARINHKVYLFSAALGLYKGWLGSLKEIFLRSPFCLLLAAVKLNLIGPNPYRYSYVPFNSARELAKLLPEINALRSGARPSYIREREIFNAWSESDNVIDTSILAQLADMASPSGFTSFTIDKKHRVAHASVVLKHSIYAARGQTVGRRLLEKANPLFDTMVAEMGRN